MYEWLSSIARSGSPHYVLHSLMLSMEAGYPKFLGNMNETSVQSEVTYPNFSYPNTSVIQTCLAKPHPLFPATFVDAKLFKWPISSVSGLTLPVV